MMPLSVSNKLGLKELQPTNVILQLADRSLTHPVGILENVLVKVNKFFIATNFVVLEMDEDVEIPIILGRPFLATSGAVIDVKHSKLTFSVDDEQVKFNLFKSCKYPSFTDHVCSVDIFTKLTNEVVRFDRLKDPLEVCLVIALMAGALKGERFSSVQQGKRGCEEL